MPCDTSLVHTKPVSYSMGIRHVKRSHTPTIPVACACDLQFVMCSRVVELLVTMRSLQKANKYYEYVRGSITTRLEGSEWDDFA